MASRDQLLALPIGVIAALPVEARSFGMRLPRNGVADLGGNAWLAVCGVGSANARRATENLLTRPLAGLVSWGTAGALSPRLEAGACLLPRTVLSADAAYEVDADWRDRVAARLSVHREICDEPLCSVTDVLVTPGQKRCVHSETGAFAADMESGAIAEMAASARIPFICVRAVLDTADTMLPAVATAGLDDEGYPSAARILRLLLSRPGQLRAVPRLLAQLNAARQTLAAVVRDSGPRLLAP